MKKLLSLVLALLLSASCMFITASAAGSSFSSATSINIGTTYSDSITANATEDYYKFTISTSGTVKLNLEAEFSYLQIYIYDSSKTDVWGNSYVTANSSGEISYLKELNLTSGTYYFVAKRYNSYDYSMGSYKFKLSFTSASESFKESGWGTNNKIANANSISLNSTYYGQIAINDEVDYYKFTLSSSGSVTLDFKSEMSYSQIYIYDSSKIEVWKNSYVTANSSGEISYSKKIDLSAGTYYFSVVRYNKTDYSMGNYNFKLSSSSSGSSSITLSVSSTSVSLEKGDTTKVNCSYTGSNANGISISYSVNNKNIATCEWGEFSNKRVLLTIKGVSVGSTTVTISLKDSETGAVLDSETFSVKVTEEGSGSGGGNTGNSGGGESIFITIIMFPIRAIIWFFGLFF